MLRLRLMATVVLGGMSLLGGPAFAQQAPTPNISAQVNEAFRAVLRDPGNLAVGHTYARLLVESGNFEGGIAALERLLLDPAADPTIRVELGVLYYRVGSYGMAESYLRAAVADPRLSGQVRTDAERLLRDVERRTAPGGQLVGSVSAGLRGQTNPTAITDTGRLMSGGVAIPVPALQERESDFDAFINAGVTHEWDLDTQNSATLVSTGSLFANHYQHAADYDAETPKYNPQDIVALAGTTGIRFKPAPVDAPDVTLRPYVGGSELLLNGQQYMAAAGGGVDVDYRTNGGATLLGATYDIRRTFFEERGDIFESGAQSGFEQFLQLRATQEVGPLQVVTADLTLRDHHAGRDYFAYQSVEARLTYAARYANPFGWDQTLWGNSLYAGPTLRYYDGADPSVDPSVTRNDTEWRIGATQLVPFADSLSLLLAVEYTSADSNLPNYTYENLMGLTSIVWNF
ncbi:tetratricopeptide repeat protein [Novispirillum sp. DQ9]|uniref:tetratricopeptide repeat protein n=1 Tax=Novispirillum sp. DQ9 TaxID=3398612 RepID=UPI003C7ABB25